MTTLVVGSGLGVSGLINIHEMSLKVRVKQLLCLLLVHQGKWWWQEDESDRIANPYMDLYGIVQMNFLIVLVGTERFVQHGSTHRIEHG